MKILHVNNFFSNYGGAERVAYNVATLLGSAGHENIFFATNREPYLFDETVDTSNFVIDVDKKSANRLNPLVVFKTFYNQEAGLKLKQVIKDQKPDLIIMHNFLYNLTVSILDICFNSGIKTVLYLHDVRGFCPGGLLAFNDTYCYDAPCVGGSSLSCIKNKCKQGKLLPSIFSALNATFMRYRKYFAKFNQIITPSIALRELAVKYGIDKNKISVLPHFITNQQMSIAEEYLSQDKLNNAGYFLYVGRLDREKGVNFLLEAIRVLPKTLLFKIVGDGDEKVALEDFARIHGLSNVEFCGKISGEELWECYTGCIATIHPFNWFEAFGLTIIESFLFAKPAIASNLGAAGELITPERGLLIEPASPEALAQAIQTVADNLDDFVMLGRNGLDFVRNNLSEDKYLSSLQSILHL